MKKILIVEDDSFLKNLESAKFSKEGYAVSTAMTAAEVDAAVAAGTPDIILLDLMLPDVDGFTLLGKFRAADATKQTPIIVFSNLSEETELKKAMDAGASDFMVKSNFTLNEVIEKIKILTN
jgi:DNA-binding response OmpR family regulator